MQGSDREGRSSDVCYVGDTRQSFSVIISSELCHIATRLSWLTQMEDWLVLVTDGLQVPDVFAIDAN